MRVATMGRGLAAAAVFFSLCLALAVPTAAQETETAAPAAQAAAVTLSGCLARTDEGALHLTTSSGVFVLTAASDEVDLTPHAGHQIEVTGHPGAVADDAAEDAPKPFSVASLKMLSESCGQR